MIAFVKYNIAFDTSWNHGVMAKIFDQMYHRNLDRADMGYFILEATVYASTSL
jgi:hypothetical protein